MIHITLKKKLNIFIVESHKTNSQGVIITGINLLSLKFNVIFWSKLASFWYYIILECCVSIISRSTHSIKSDMRYNAIKTSPTTFYHRNDYILTIKNFKHFNNSFFTLFFFFLSHYIINQINPLSFLISFLS